MKKPKPGQDLATLHPEIAKEWCQEENGEHTPRDFSCGSHYRAYWVCPNGHVYPCPIKDRVSKGRSCPTCKKRLKTSFPEQALFFYVKQAFPDAINGDREVLGDGKELDVFVPSLMIAVEYDGSHYHTDEKLVAEREKYKACKQKGIKLIRVKENKNHCKGDLELSDYIVPCTQERFKFRHLTHAIKLVLEIMGDVDFAELFSVEKLFGLTLPPSPREDIAIESVISWPADLPSVDPKIKTDVDVGRDERIIQESFLCGIEHRNLEEVYPDIAKEWHPTKNGKLTPKMFSPAAGKKVWWLCPKGHSYRQLISERTRRDSGCPYCSGRYALPGENDFATLHSDLLKEWDWEANSKIGLNPRNLKPMSDVEAHWICSKCGHKWVAPIKSRSKGFGCWECANQLRNQKACKTVYVYDEKRRFICEYRSISAASKATGVAKANICRACNHGYRPLQKGFYFSYKKPGEGD